MRVRWWQTMNMSRSVAWRGGRSVGQGHFFSRRMASFTSALALSVEGEGHGGAVPRASLPLDARLERGWRVGGEVSVLGHRCAGGCGELTPASHILSLFF